jgi:hypothetical protein
MSLWLRNDCVLRFRDLGNRDLKPFSA